MTHGNELIPGGCLWRTRGLGPCSRLLCVNENTDAMIEALRFNQPSRIQVADSQFLTDLLMLRSCPQALRRYKNSQGRMRPEALVISSVLKIIVGAEDSSSLVPLRTSRPTILLMLRDHITGLRASGKLTGISRRAIFWF